FSTTDPVAVTPQAEAPRLAVNGPISFSVERTPAWGTTGQVQLGALERAGLYTLDGTSAADRIIAVNLADPAESRLDTADWLTPSAAAAAGHTDPVDAAVPHEVWPWFVLGGLILASIEWLLYAWRMRA